MAARKPPHLLEPFDGDEGGERLALSLDDELVVPESDAVQHVPDSLADIHGRYSVCHSMNSVNYDSCDICAMQGAKAWQQYPAWTPDCSPAHPLARLLL